ncbi:MAG TPA: fumarylacetoacetate hydrolase family protein [Candidatus Koribacter sp.]|jgi:2-keto-4-pentenoate hydratase/2-oxohepta-3-ene-1,7-dioic acid hydratase in catechol pathway
MRYCRFVHRGQPKYGLIETENTRDYIVRAIATMPQDYNTFAGAEPLHLALEDAELLASVVPSKILCVGRNYAAHAKELGNEVPKYPLIFMKPTSSIIAPGAQIKRPAKLSRRVDFEGELGVIIGRECRHIPNDHDIRPYIHGYTVVNDVTARDLQKQDGQWTRGKGFDTFCPVGPIVNDALDPWAGVDVETRVNGEVKQRGTTTDFIFPLEVVIRFIADVMTLFPGDLIATGTPEGVGPVVAGDVVEVSVSGIGTLENPVVDE